MQRNNLSKTGQMLLSNNSPIRYDDGNKNYKTGPNFLNKFRSRPPSENELKQAQTSLGLLKQKMTFMGNNTVSNPINIDPMDAGGYRKKFVPGQASGGNGIYSDLDDINRREKMLMNNIGMINDNLHAQRQIIKDKNDIYGDQGRGGGRSDFNGRIIQDFDNYGGAQDQGRMRQGHGFDPKVYGPNGKAIEDPMS